ncbi:MAG: phosphoribosylformylglycinamidine synthase subunit PurQ [Bdellovibrionales bacterium]|nr:phosphoribosylformylglycinamidine synthase subunit PurQ [Bdellovibrionales bacterium]
MSTVWILLGEGIECERESERFFSDPTHALGLGKAERLPVPRLLAHPQSHLQKIQRGDWLFLPGGFSFADHFGSGKLISFELRRAGVFDHCAQHGVNLMGVCNGFQMMVEAGLFGEGVALRANLNRAGRPTGFVNRWVQLRGAGPLKGQDFFLPVRHGEGRLTRSDSHWAPGVEAFLTYNDESFENGSIDATAGLLRRTGDQLLVGLMPHPEIAARAADAPDHCGPEWPAENRHLSFSPDGDGLRLVRSLVKGVKDSHA